MKNKKYLIAKEKVINILKDMLPFEELEFDVILDKTYKRIKSIIFFIYPEFIKISKGKGAAPIYPNDNKERKCLKDIYMEFEEEIQELFNLEL